MNIFLIGDSIRVDYGSYVESYIGKDINIIGKEGIEEAYQNLDIPVGSNCGDSRMLVEYLKTTENLGRLEFEYFVFNCGLHDVKRTGGEEKLAVDQKEYEENLRTILGLMKDKKVIFITSTPVERERYPEGFPFVRYEDDVVEYNRIANNVMHSYNVEVIDMYSFTKSLGLCGDALYRDHAHFHKQIIQLQAAYLAGALSALVKRESV
jgi:hypothetical protein